MEVNKAQEEAVHTINGPVIIISCPGSGKTTTLLRRIRYMTESGIDPSSILMVTFTKAAAKDMKERYAAMTGGKGGAVFATIHSFCLAVLMHEGLRKPSDILPEDQKFECLFHALEKTPGVEDAWNMTSDMIKGISGFKNTYKDIRMYDPDFSEADLFRKMYNVYEEYKAAVGKIDYEDLIRECLDLFKSDPAVLAKYQDRFPYVQCDEYQDTNLIQKDILYLLTKKSRNLCVVGDDDQSIYRFRGADPQVMLDFKTDFPDAKIIRMGTNYRSCKEIVDISDLLIRSNRTRFPKEFISFRGQKGEEGYFDYLEKNNKAEEMDDVISHIKGAYARGIPYKDMAVLIRTNKQAQFPMKKLKDGKIPFDSTEKVKSIYEGWIFRIIRSYVRLSVGEGSRADMLSVLNRPSRYLKPSMFYHASYTYKGMMDAIAPLEQGEYWRYKNARKNMVTWMTYFGPGVLKWTSDPKDIFTGMSAMGILRYIDDFAAMRKTEPEEYQSIYDELKKDSMMFRTIRDWFAYGEEEVEKTSALNSKDPDGVVITTMHKAKGREWKIVFVIDVNGGIVPHRSNSKTPEGIEEERRLLYVAMTRAKDELYVYSSGVPSSFMTDIMPSWKRKVAKEKNISVKAGSLMKHKKFGVGLVTKVTDDKITLDFMDEEKQFQYPDAIVQGFLTPVKG